MSASEILDKLRMFVAAAVSKALAGGHFLWRFLSLSLADDRIAPRRRLSVLLERGGLSIVFASRFLSRIKIRGIRHYPFEVGKYPTPENLVSKILLAVRDLDAVGVPITLIVPRSWAIVKTAEFPLAVKENLSAVVSYEMDRLTPMDAEHACYDFGIIEEGGERLRILLTVMRSDILQSYLEPLREGGIHVDQAIVGSFAFGVLSAYLRGRGSTIFADIRADGYEGGIIHEGKWYASFTGKLSSDDDESSVRAIVEEIQPLIEQMKKGGENPEVLVDHDRSSQWRNTLRERLRAPVRFVREADLGISLPTGSEGKQGVPFTALGGALSDLWPGVMGVNLLAKGVHKSAKTPMFLTIVLLSILVALGLFWLVSPLQVEEWKIETLDREISARKDEVKKIEVLKKEVENVEKEIAAIAAFKTPRPMALILLKEMTRVLPKNAWLSRIRIGDTTVDIEGYAASATEILSKLEVSEYFKKVEFSTPTFRDPRLNSDRFNIKMEIEGLPEAKAEYGKKK